MQRLIIFVLTALFLVALLSFAVTYTVRFTETAVLTTFGNADEDSIQTDAGLKFKFPYPVQTVTKYDTRTRYLEAALETQQTADDRLIIIRAFCAWNVENPDAFFRNFSDAGDRADDHYRKAESIIRSGLRAALAETSSFRMDELLAPEASESRLPELERRVQAALTAAQADGSTLADAGIGVKLVGISQLRLAESTTRAVIERMSENRDRLAQELQSEGFARGDAIRARAEAQAARIRAFAERRASEIRAMGDQEAARFLAQMNENPELAIFLRELDFMRNAMARRATFVWSASMPGMRLLQPDALETVRRGEIPGMAAPATDGDNR